jgi:GTP1/Obg family GTP-binding protein
MKSRKADKSASLSASQAMNTVLKAEQETAHSIEECRAAARRTIDEAQQKSTRIARRTNERITTIHLRSKQKLARIIADMERKSAGELRDARDAVIEDDQLSTAIDNVAKALVGIDNRGPTTR